MSLKVAVCVNHYSPSIGGAENVVQKIVEEIQKYHNVCVFTRQLKQQKRNPSDFSVKIYEYTPQNVLGFINQFEKIDPDIVLVYSDMFDFFRYLITKKQSKFKLLFCPCGANWLHQQRNYINHIYRILDNIKGIVCHSKFERDYKLFSTEKFCKKLHIIPNGIDLLEFDNNHLTKNDLLPEFADKKWILNVSNFFPGKGQEHLFSILKKIPDHDDLVYVQIANDIDFQIGVQLEGKWKIEAKKNKEIKSKLLKNLDREKVIGFFKQSNVLAFTSEKEVAPLVLLEAMAASLPWVATNVGNAEELHGGFVVKTIKDSNFYSRFTSPCKEQFSYNISQAIDSPKTGENGRTQIEKQFVWDKILPQYLRLIEE